MATLAAAMARAAPGAEAIPAGAVALAEVEAAEVVRRLQPTEASERRRAGVVDFARRLVGAALGCEVFAFGSVPLKTYLPDGDIDLTVLGNTSYHSTLIDDVYCLLKSEEQNSDAEFEVKDLQSINAEVRLIKCTIENIIIDISFNQTGGICALCFLELVDRKVGKNHLFKRSIILIKAWCYYESRLLGAHHGLISTYALETLILYIFNLFHKYLHGPLEVLYRFLEYFSKFDWDNYCISLNGPVALSSLPNLIVEATNTHDDDLLFDKEFLRSSVDKAFVPPRDSNACYTKFRVKHLNIIDPLKEYNNLGRSVNRASFNRIRTALSYGAQKLGRILMLPPEIIPDEIYGFFKNTLKRNGRGVRPDIGNDGYDGAFHCRPFLGPGKALLEDISSMRISYKKEDENRSPHHLSKSLANNDSNIKINGPTHLGVCSPGHHKVASSTDLSTKSSCFVHHTPKQHVFYQENGNGSSEQYYMDHDMQGQVPRCTVEAFHVDDGSLMQPQVHVNSSSLTLNSSTRGNTLELSKPGLINKKHHLAPFSSLSLVDLSGDLDSQLRCLRQIQYHLEYLFDGFLQSVQEASSDDKVDKDLINIPTLSILLNTDVTLPLLLSPSSAETDGRKSSPVSSSHSTEDVPQRSQDEDHWGMASQQSASGTDVPFNGLSPSSSYADSESSVSWCHSSEDVPNTHGPYIPKKHMASLGEKGKTLINQPVKIKNSQASVPKGSFFPYKEQIALSSGTKEITTSQPLKVQDSLHGCIHSDRKMIETQSCDTQKGCVKHDNEARQIPRYHGDVCWNKNLFEKQSYDTDMEFAHPASSMKQMPKYQPLEVQDTPNECTYINNSLARKQTCDTRKGHEVLGWPTKQVPVSDPLKLQSSLRGRVWSNKNSAAKQNYDNHKEHLSFVRDAEHVPSSQAPSILNGLKREVNSKNGGKPRPLLPKGPLSASNTRQPSFTVMKGYSQYGASETPPETIEFGSLGPFSLTFFSSNKAPNTLPTSKACADASALLLQSYRVGATQSRSSGLHKSPGLHRLGDEDHFPPLHAGTR